MPGEREFRVLVATDGSRQAGAAVATAVGFPWPDGTRVRGVTARQTRAPYRRSLLLAALDRSADVAAEKARQALAVRWPEADVRVVDAAPVAGILNEARRVGADVIVLGWRGVGAIQPLIMGSVSRGVLRGATASVLIVKGRRPNVRRIALGFDGSTNARRAVAVVAALRPPRGGQVTLCSAVDQMGVPTQPFAPGHVRAAVASEVARINAQRTEEARNAAERAAASLKRAGWRVNTVVSVEPPLRALLRAIHTGRADLLVIGARGTGGVRRLVMGSVAEGAVNRCDVPVLVVR